MRKTVAMLDQIDILRKHVCRLQSQVLPRDAPEYVAFVADCDRLKEETEKLLSMIYELRKVEQG